MTTPPRHLGLGPGKEFDYLRKIAARLGGAAADLGDDCALIPLPVPGTAITASIDASLEGVHFRTDWLSFEEIGWRAGVAGLSDLAAEGAQPLGLLVSLGVPGTDDDAPTAIMSGVGAAAHAAGTKILGGDLLKSDKYLVDVCALGSAERPVRRTGAKAGDGLWVTGELGGARLALRSLLAGHTPQAEARQRFARPVPRIPAGMWLARMGATAMIDVSDGLASDARHLAVASGVALEIALERVPCWLGADPLLAVASGEEYELLVALPASFGPTQAEAFREFHDLPLTRVGSCAAGDPGVRFTDRGQTIAPPRGFDHFA